MNIIIVDDSEVIRERLTELVSSMDGMKVVGEAENALDGTKVVRELRPDVVILDIKMPLGSGLDVLRNIQRSNPAVQVIILTNYPYDQYRKKCVELGARVFFDKSTEFNQIPGVLNRIKSEIMGETVEN